MKQIWRIFDSILEWVLVSCTFAMAVLCFTQVVFRYVFNSSIPWSEEASRYLFSVVVFFGGIICVRDKGHVCVDIIIQQAAVQGKALLQPPALCFDVPVLPVPGKSRLGACG